MQRTIAGALSANHIRRDIEVTGVEPLVREKVLGKLAAVEHRRMDEAWNEHTWLVIEVFGESVTIKLDRNHVVSVLEEQVAPELDTGVAFQ